MTNTPRSKAFKGAAKPADPSAIAVIADRIGVEKEVLMAVLRVEAPRGPFDARGRPVILYEGHVFWRNLSPDLREDANRQRLAWPHWDRTLYPRGGQDPMYAALERACEIDETAALKACSWGGPQILGENHAMVGFETVQEMVLAFMEGEAEQIAAFAAYIDAANLEIQLRAKDWAGFAQIYNGPGYTAHRYDERIAEAYAELKAAAEATEATEAPPPPPPPARPARVQAPRSAPPPPPDGGGNGAS